MQKTELRFDPPTADAGEFVPQMIRAKIIYRGTQCVCADKLLTTASSSKFINSAKVDKSLEINSPVAIRCVTKVRKVCQILHCSKPRLYLTDVYLPSRRFHAPDIHYCLSRF